MQARGTAGDRVRAVIGEHAPVCAWHTGWVALGGTDQGFQFMELPMNRFRMSVLAVAVLALTAVQEAPTGDWTLVARYPSGKVGTVRRLPRQFCSALEDQAKLDPDPSQDGAQIECVQR